MVRAEPAALPARSEKLGVVRPLSVRVMMDASAGVDEPLEEVVARAHDVVARVFMKERSEEGFAEDALGDAAYGGCAEPLAKGPGVGSVVGAAVPQLLPSGGGDHPVAEKRDTSL